ncbi:hypothetical protein PGTUg99_014035 [Puccinia graminis f. sp. tritici]|uniref:Uncharacterized protein n=1 Tax=Puccinia graminis f. sp. tritici TaxID=56615 RepID=A0A5B0R5K1_PUCGR|nr:hypothetical protein PGTUg99_014035 [Puccinia graminis f. sp. tritici]
MKRGKYLVLLGLWGIAVTSTNFDFVSTHAGPLLEAYTPHFVVQNEDVNFNELHEYLTRLEGTNLSSSNLRGQAEASTTDHTPAQMLTESRRAYTKHLMESPGACPPAMSKSGDCGQSLNMGFDDGSKSEDSVTNKSSKILLATSTTDEYTPEIFKEMSACQVMDELIDYNLDDYFDFMESGARFQSIFKADNGQF